MSGSITTVVSATLDPGLEEVGESSADVDAHDRVHGSESYGVANRDRRGRNGV
jgi:hypothetical protein